MLILPFLKSLGLLGSSSRTPVANSLLRTATFDPLHDDSECYSAHDAQVYVNETVRQGYNVINIYGTSCNQAQAIFEAVLKHKENLTIVLGSSSTERFHSDINNFINFVNGRWEKVALVGLFNEGDPISKSEPLYASLHEMAIKTLAENGYKGGFLMVNVPPRQGNHQRPVNLIDFAKVKDEVEEPESNTNVANGTDDSNKEDGEGSFDSKKSRINLLIEALDNAGLFPISSSNEWDGRGGLEESLTALLSWLW